MISQVRPVGGAALPRKADPLFRNSLAGVANIDTQARVASLYEVHLLGLYALPHGGQTWVLPQAGFGVSMMHIKSDLSVTAFDNAGAGTTRAYHDSHNAFSPLFRLGLLFFPNRRVSGSIDASYVAYGNTVRGGGQTANLGISGWTVREMARVRF